MRGPKIQRLFLQGLLEMQLENLKRSSKERIAMLNTTHFKDMVPQLDSAINFLDKINPKSDTVRQFVIKEYESIIRYVDEQITSNKLFPNYETSNQILGRPHNMQKRITIRLVEALIKNELLGYVKLHGAGKIFTPHAILETATNAHKIINNGQIDIGLSIEPEGCAYGYFFDAQGLKVLHVFADFDGKGGIDYRSVDDLHELTGKRALIIEDDVQTGITLRTVISKISQIRAASFAVFLGNGLVYQNLNAVPPDIFKIYLNTTTETGCNYIQLEQNLIDFFGLRLFEKYSVFLNNHFE